MKTVVTEHQQLQLWIELHVPMFDAVTAVVYFTLKDKQHIQQEVTTHSILTENTVMVFQLELHDIPERFQKEDFLVQVALKVGTKEGSVVPSSLQEASTGSKKLFENVIFARVNCIYVYSLIPRSSLFHEFLNSN